MMATPAARVSLGYLPALDGLRGVSILAVLGRHSGWLGGGYLGVDVFFALSGFLITSLLIEEYARAGTITLRLFYARRALRLLPALVVLIVVCTGTLLATGPAELGSLAIRTAAAVLFYVANWAWVIGLPLGVYSHTWSLGIEEQFYLLWPLALLGLLRGVRDRRAITALVLLMAVAGIGWRIALVHAGAPLDHVYQGLDAHGDALLIGCAASLALSWSPVAPAAAHLGGIIGAAVLAVLFVVATFPDDYVRHHVSTLTAVAAALLIVNVVCLPRSWLARGLALRPLTALGRISYGIYLWHFPVFLRLGALSFHDEVHPWPAVVGAWAATLAVSVASYAIVERPALALKATLRPRTGA